jgi:hypothetical protein
MREMAKAQTGEAENDLSDANFPFSPFPLFPQPVLFFLSLLSANRSLD